MRSSLVRDRDNRLFAVVAARKDIRIGRRKHNLPRDAAVRYWGGRYLYGSVIRRRGRRACAAYRDRGRIVKNGAATLTASGVPVKGELNGTAHRGAGRSSRNRRVVVR